ncbi:MAG: lysylphosphatidylglycerol synthetase family protein [Phycisphaeraceae bacterium]|nr:lysylphosphatidylglycerol synthetase family protein [Phycisphaeraceae bacterium]
MSQSPPVKSVDAPAKRSRLWRVVSISLRIIVPAAVLAFVWKELQRIDIDKTRIAIEAADARLVIAAGIIAILGVCVMGFYDALAMPAGSTMRFLKRWRLGSIIFAWMNLLTIGPIGGPALRLFFYRRAGIATGDIVAGLARLYVGVNAGLVGWGTAALLPLGESAGATLVRCLVAAVLTPAAAVIPALSPPLRRLLKLPEGATRRLALLGCVSFVDWLCVILAFSFCARAAGVDAPLDLLTRAFLLGQVAGIMSMIPGGLGAADGIWLRVTTASGEGADIAAAMVVLFRTTYYLVPWFLSALALYVMFAERSAGAMQLQRRVVAVITVCAGLLLLLSAAIPELPDDIRTVRRHVPLAAIELSHILGVIAAIVMILVARGLSQGYRGAYRITLGSVIAAGISHLVHEFDIENALLTLIVAVLLFGARRSFTQTGRLPRGMEYTLAAIAAIGVFFAMPGMLALRRSPPLGEVWSTYRLDAHGVRFLRALMIAGGLAFAALVVQALRPRMLNPPTPVEPTDIEADGNTPPTPPPAEAQDRRTESPS